MKINILGTLIGLVFFGCGQRNQSLNSLKGDFRTSYVSDAYLLYRQQPSWQQISSFISHVNPGRRDDRLTTDQLAKDIAGVARCFKIDALLFGSLIRTESLFERSAVSPTGAVGLTQFTSIGIREVNDQLGNRGLSYGRSSATTNFRNTIDDCVVDEFGIPWIDLWERSSTTMRDMKNNLKNSPVYALVYGAILLKTKLSVAKTAARRNGTSERSAPLYNHALWHYNGDPNVRVRDRYVSNIRESAREFHRLFLR